MVLAVSVRLLEAQGHWGLAFPPGPPWTGQSVGARATREVGSEDVQADQQP